MNQFPCTCGGNNPNCFRCDGTGMVARPTLGVGRPHRDFAKAAIEAEQQQSRDEQPSNPTVRRDPTQTLFQHANWDVTHIRLMHVQCPICGIAIQKSRLAKHQRKVHGDATSTTTLNRPLKHSVPNNWTNCKICGARVKHLERHNEKVHGVLPQLNSASEASARKSRKLKEKSDSLRLTQCPFCKVKAPTNRVLMAHISKVHGERAAHEVESRNSSEGKDRKNEVANDSRSLDAKFQWGATFRDNGQFGSYPLHDDMGDESNP